MNKCFSEFFLSRVAGCCWCCFSSHALFCAISLVRILLISHTTTANIGLFCTYIYIFNDFVIAGFQMYLSHSFCGVFHSFRWQWATLHVLVWLQCVDECKKKLIEIVHNVYYTAYAPATVARKEKKESMKEMRRETVRGRKREKTKPQRLHSLCQSQPVYQTKCKLQHNIIVYSGARFSYFYMRMFTHGIKYFKTLTYVYVSTIYLFVGEKIVQFFASTTLNFGISWIFMFSCISLFVLAAAAVATTAFSLTKKLLKKSAPFSFLYPITCTWP